MGRRVSRRGWKLVDRGLYSPLDEDGAPAQDGVARASFGRFSFAYETGKAHEACRNGLLRGGRLDGIVGSAGGGAD